MGDHSENLRLTFTKVPVEIRQMLPEEELTDKEKEDNAKAASDKAARDRLDEVSKNLITATAVVIAVMAALGLTGDRIAILLNSTHAKTWILVAISAAAVAVIGGLVAVGTDKLTVERVSVAVGVFAFFVSLGSATWAASTAFDDDGRPTITALSVADASEGAAVSLSFSVSSDGAAKDSWLRVVAIWVRNSRGETQEPPFYSAVLRPDAKGLINQTVTAILPRPDADRYVRVQVIRMSDQPIAQDLVEPQPGTLCSDQDDQKMAPACSDVLVPAARPQGVSP